MAFNPKFHVGREEFFVPSSSTYLWNSADTLNDHFGERIFSVLIEKKQDSNDPNYHLSASVAYDNSALERVKEPLRAALTRKIAAVNLLQPDMFISFADMDAMKFPHMRLITAQWVIFNQDPNSMDPPSLSISSHENGSYYDLYPVVVCGMSDFFGLHSEYTLIAPSIHDAQSNVIAGLYVHGDDQEQRYREMYDGAPETRDEFKLHSVDQVTMVELNYLPEDALGITPSPVSIIDGDGQAHRLESFNIDDGVKINFAMFGLVKPQHDDMHVHFPDPAVKPLRYYPDGPLPHERSATPPAMSGMLRHLLNILEENGTWPQREVPKRNILSRTMRRLFRLGD